MTERERGMKKPDLSGKLPESWACTDCGINTAPGLLNREQMEQGLACDWNDQGVTQTLCERSEVYMVKANIWNAEDVGSMSGCVCIGCLETRLGRLLTPKDFMRNHPLAIGVFRCALRSVAWWRGCFRPPMQDRNHCLMFR